MELDIVINKILTAAYEEAKMKKHEYLTPEHVLYASLFFDEGIEILSNSGCDTEELKKYLEDYFKDYVPVTESEEIIQSLGFIKLFQCADEKVASSGRNKITLGDVYISFFEDDESYANYFLQKSGVTKLALLEYVAHGISVISDISEDIIAESSFRKEKGSKSDREEPAYEDTNPHQNLLKLYTIDLTEKAKNGEIDPLIGREDIIERTLQVLCRRYKNNPVHVGDPGVGKTAITEGLALLIASNKVPKSLKSSRIFYLDLASLLAGAKYRGEFEDRIKKVLNIIESMENSIVYIDEIHTLVGAGAISGGSMDASNIIKPFLTNGKIKFIGSTTYEEYKKHFEKDRALSRRFQKIEIPEPSTEDTIKILNGIKSKYEAFHNVIYTDEAIKLACTLSSKYIQDRHLPDKAIDILDESGAYARLHEEDDQKCITIKENDIERIVSAIAKIPEQSVSSNEIEKLKSLDIELKKVIFGQDHAIDTIVKAIKRSRAGFNEAQEPVASLLFVGPTGVGKTEISRQLSYSLGIPLIRFDMSEYQEKHTVSRLVGAPPGYVGYDEGGLLTDSIRKTPYCVLLLDEIEKAHPDILNILLQVMDYATLTDNNGKKADFRNVILIMTSNAGARELGKKSIGFNDNIVNLSSISNEVDRIFSPEFRNRLNEIVIFNSLNKQMAMQIAKKALSLLEDKLNAKDLNLKVTEKCYDFIIDRGFSSKYGAREILRIIDQDIKTLFVDEVLFGNLSKGQIITVDVENDKIILKK